MSNLESVKALEGAESLLENERENFINFLRFVKRKAENEEQELLLDGLMEDVKDAKHINPAYQQ